MTSKKLEKILFVGLIVFYLAPLWTFNYFPSQDGPAHLNTANVLLEYNLSEKPIFREYFVLNKEIEPNWLVQLTLVGLMTVFPKLTAEKIFLSVYVILFPISLRYTLRTVHPEASFLAIWSFPFIYNYLLHTGLYNFSISLPIFFFVTGFWIKHQNQFSIRKLLALALLSLLLYFSHILSLVMAYVLIGVLATCQIFRDGGYRGNPDSDRKKRIWKRLKKWAGPPALASLPCLLLSGIFLHHEKAILRYDEQPLWWRYKPLAQIESLVSFDKQEYLLSGAIAFFLIALFIFFFISKFFRQSWSTSDDLIFVTFVFLVIYFIAPDGVSGGTLIIPRLTLFPYLALILWLGTLSYPRVMKRVIQTFAGGVGIILLGLHSLKYSQLNEYLDEYLSGMHLIKSNTTLLPISFSNKGVTPDGQSISLRISPFLHLSGYIAAEKGVIDFTHYQARTQHFPIAFRSNMNPYQLIGTRPDKVHRGLESNPPQINFLSFSRDAAGYLDYILVWNPFKKQQRDPSSQFIYQQLNIGYELIYTSPQRGWMNLYRRKDWAHRPFRKINP